MADRTFSILTQLSLNSDDFKRSVDAVKGNVKDLMLGVEGVNGNLGEMRRALMALKNTSFVGKSPEEIKALNKQMGVLMDEMSDLRAMQKGMGMDLTALITKGLQGITAIAELGVGAAQMFGLSKESAEKYNKAMVALIGISQAFVVIQALIEERTFQVLAARLSDTVAMYAQIVATKLATAAQWLYNASLFVLIGTIGLVVAAVVAITAGIYYLITAFKKHNEEQKLVQEEIKRTTKIREDENKWLVEMTKTYSSSYAKQKAAIDMLLTSAKDEHRSLNDRKLAISELIKLHPEYLNGLTLQNLTTEKGIGLVKDLIKQLQEKAKQQAYETTLVALYEVQIQKQEQILRNTNDINKLQAQRKNVPEMPIKEKAEFTYEGIMSNKKGLTKYQDENKALKDIDDKIGKIANSTINLNNELTAVNNTIESISKGVSIDPKNMNGYEALKRGFEGLQQEISLLETSIKDGLTAGHKPTDIQIEKLQALKREADQIIAKMKLIEEGPKELKMKTGVVSSYGADGKPSTKGAQSNLMTGQPVPMLDMKGIASSQAAIKQTFTTLNSQLVQSYQQATKAIMLDDDQLTKHKENQYERRLKKLNESLAKEEISQKDYTKKLKSLEDEKNRYQETSTLSNFSKNAVFDKIFTKLKVNEYNDRFVALKNDLAKEKITQTQYNSSVKQLEEDKEKDKVSAMSQTFALGASMFEKNTIAYKAFATAQAVMDTYAAANVALKSAPPPYNFILMGMTVAAGLVNVAKINGAFAQGGIVPGSQYSGDNVPVMANSGEMILNTTQQRNLFSMVDRGSGEQSGREVIFKIQGTQLVGVLNNQSRKLTNIK